MYKQEGRPLKEVMRVMETEHQFLATPKMYKKRIKDWAIDKNQKSDRAFNTPRTKQQRDATQSGSQCSVRGTADNSQEISNHIGYCSDPAQQPQDVVLPSSEEDMERRYTDPEVMLPPQQQDDGQYWSRASQSHDDDSFPASLSQNGQPADPVRASVLLSSIRHRFLAASDTVLRRDTARLFEILNPAYEAMSEVADTEAEQLLSVVVDLFELLHRRSNHQDMLRQLLHYVLALVPDAVRQNEYLSRDRQVLSLLEQSEPEHPVDVSLDPADGTVSGSRHNCYEQAPGDGVVFDTRSGGECAYPY
ncbi:hypothetical protein diail_1583 [Diaporthe ilicicola]|nr:hypothetical protein diail_1583 [Diaporthe ilicicola]